MSLFTTSNVTCPACGAVVNTSAVGSVNADRRPDLRDDILADTFQDTTCENCGLSFRLEPDFNYLDVGRGQWIAAQPALRVADFPEVEDEVRSVFDASFGAGAQPAARDVGSLLTLRLTFGWPATREKILIRDLGLDDLSVELLKLDLMRRLPEAPAVGGIEMRLIAMRGDLMDFAFLDAETEEPVQEFSANRALYDAIADRPEPWAGLRARLSEGPFVDMQRLILSVPVAGAAAE